MSTDTRPPCVARCDQPPHYLRTHACPNRATQRVGELDVCGVHARVARRWQAEGRLELMVETYWRP